MCRLGRDYVPRNIFPIVRAYQVFGLCLLLLLLSSGDADANTTSQHNQPTASDNQRDELD